MFYYLFTIYVKRFFYFLINGNQEERMKIKVGQRLIMMVLMFLVVAGVKTNAQEGKNLKIGISQFCRASSN